MSRDESGKLKKVRAGIDEPERVRVYVDGMNLYHGVRSTRVPSYQWLDVWALSKSFLRPGQVLSRVKYYTSRFVSDCEDIAMVSRQGAHLDALGTFDNLDIIEGKFLSKTGLCKQCGHEWQSYEEKMTDVNIAIGLMNDAEDNLYDIAIVVSGDGDLASPVETVLLRHPGKVVLVALPPNRRSASLLRVASAHIDVGRGRLRNCQLPDRLRTATGYPLRRPAEWS